MKIIVTFVVIAVIVAVVAWILWSSHTSPQRTDAMTSEQAGPQPHVLADLRKQLLRGAPTDFGIDVKTMHKGMWGILMETGYEEGTTTLVCLCDGTASLYLGGGGGILGGQAHAAVRVAGAELLALASDHLKDMALAEVHPMPEVGQVRFYAMTSSGVFTAKGDEERMGEGDHKLSPVFLAGHEVITHLLATKEERPPSRDDMDKLLDEGLQAAVRFLEKRGEFYPFGRALLSDGELAFVSTWDGDEQPKSDDVLANLVESFRQHVEKYKAVAIVANVTIRKTPTDPPTDAVRVQIEHRDAAPAICFLPYRMEGGKCITGEVWGQRGEPLIFGRENR